MRSVNQGSACRRPLQSIELQGYKSFAARTVFEIGKAITAVVGPNGTGKSNIADAIRWVLGEQTYSLLRGRKTEDMIFSGSEARSRTGMASVTIHFDNSDGWLPIEFTEVSIGRRAHRDGQNEYLLNGQRVRLREISELLAGSGLARRTYTIIGQGLVDSVLSLKAEDRRQLFEEAAGIGLHRSRREEAVRRLDKTRRNLERVEDMLREVRPRLRGLERQAKRAKDYEQVREDLKEALKLWYGYHWYRHQEALRAAKERVQEATQKREALLAELETTSEQLQAARESMDRLRRQHDQAAKKIVERKAAIEALSRKQAVAEARLEWIRERDAGLTIQIQEGEAARDRLAERLRAARESVSSRRQDAEEAERRLAELRPPGARGLEKRTGDLKQRLEARSAKIAHLERQQARLEAALERLRSLEDHGRLLERIMIAARQGELLGLVGSLQGNLSCDPRHRKAIDVALEVYGQGLLFEDDAAVDRGLDWLSRIGAPGRISLMAGLGRGLPSLQIAQDQGCLGTALHLVRVSEGFQPAAEWILGRTVVAKDRAAARRLVPELPLDARVVTLAGEVFFAAGPVLRLGGRQAKRETLSEEQASTALQQIRRRLADAERERGTLLAMMEQASADPGHGKLEEQLRRAREAEVFSLQIQSQLEEQLAALESDLASRQETWAAGKAEHRALSQELRAIREELGAQEGALETEQIEESNLAAELGAERHGRSEREIGLEQARSALRTADGAYTQAEVELARRREEMHGIERRIQDDLGLVSFDHDERVVVQDPLPLNGWVERLPKMIELPAGLDREVNRLRGRIRRMGPINGEAWEEYQEVRERVEFLTSQLEDLRKAEGQLREVISHLDDLMQREFKSTFHAVAEAFQAYFKRLFQGGSARLSLAEGTSLEETGIEIEVRLPGRREQGLAMLSGGERSLTACALIFALLKLSPTPFCVLDEVDAMLDESNVVRFCEILRELAQDTQFLVITHNRQTIQQAEVVYGVSLGQDKASEVISLRLEEAAQELAA